MSPHKRALGRLIAAVPNRKLAATRLLATEARLVRKGDEAALVRANAAFVWSYYLRFAQLALRGGRKRAYERMETVGEERLLAAVREQKGTILLSVHLGDFDAGGGWLYERHGITPVVVVAPLRPRWRKALFALVRRRCGVLLREVGITSLDELERDLRRRRAVLVMLDRRAPGPTSPSQMLGNPAVAPAAVGLLAARSQAPLLPAATWRDENGRLVAWFGEPFIATDPAQAMSRIAEAAEQLGELIRAHPEQWHVPAELEQLSWVSTGIQETLNSRSKVNPWAREDCDHAMTRAP
jgi:lauroyl/myristoyl acyltransferase